MCLWHFIQCVWHFWLRICFGINPWSTDLNSWDTLYFLQLIKQLCVRALLKHRVIICFLLYSACTWKIKLLLLFKIMCFCVTVVMLRLVTNWNASENITVLHYSQARVWFSPADITGDPGKSSRLSLLTTG